MHDPYNGFKNDDQRRRALRIREIRNIVVGVAFAAATAIGGEHLKILTWLQTLL